MMATSLLRRTLRPGGLDAQSMALASTPGTVPLYSGVAIRTAFDVVIASLKWLDFLWIATSLNILVKEWQLADVEDLYRDPIGCDLLCRT